MKRINHLLTIVLLLILAVTGCKKSDSDPVSPADGLITNSSLTGQPMPAFSDQTDINGVMASIYYSITSPIAGIPPIGMSLGFATFGSGADAGTVKVNTNTLGKLVQSSMTYYLSPDPLNPLVSVNLNWNGTDHAWTVAGGNGIPSISGSVKSPNDFTVTSPLASAVVAKASGIQLKWSNPSSSKVLIQIVSLTNSGIVKVYQDQVDNGNFTIPAADLASFSGDCTLFVVKYNYNLLTVSAKKYVIVSEIVKNLIIKVN